MKIQFFIQKRGMVVQKPCMKKTEPKLPKKNKSVPRAHHE